MWAPRAFRRFAMATVNLVAAATGAQALGTQAAEAQAPGAQTAGTQAAVASGPAAAVANEQNRERPELASADLQERASHLFAAIAANDTTLADDFFFPREPFLPLKDVADPGRYFDQLRATYHREIRELHGRRRSWEDAHFAGFELGTRPTWVSPGEEWNKIGYYRTFRGKLSYEVAGRKQVLEVMTLISWEGKWYVTHLLPIARQPKK